MLGGVIYNSQRDPVSPSTREKGKAASSLDTVDLKQYTLRGCQETVKRGLLQRTSQVFQVASEGMSRVERAKQITEESEPRVLLYTFPDGSWVIVKPLSWGWREWMRGRRRLGDVNRIHLTAIKLAGFVDRGRNHGSALLLLTSSLKATPTTLAPTSKAVKLSATPAIPAEDFTFPL